MTDPSLLGQAIYPPFLTISIPANYSSTLSDMANNLWVESEPCLRSYAATVPFRLDA